MRYGQYGSWGASAACSRASAIRPEPGDGLDDELEPRAGGPTRCPTTLSPQPLDTSVAIDAITTVATAARAGNRRAGLNGRPPRGRPPAHPPRAWRAPTRPATCRTS